MDTLAIRLCSCKVQQGFSFAGIMSLVAATAPINTPTVLRENKLTLQMPPYKFETSTRRHGSSEAKEKSGQK